MDGATIACMIYTMVFDASVGFAVVQVPNVSWNDVGGLEDVKRELQETVQVYPTPLYTALLVQRIVVVVVSLTRSLSWLAYVPAKPRPGCTYLRVCAF